MVKLCVTVVRVGTERPEQGLDKRSGDRVLVDKGPTGDGAEEAGELAH